MGGRDCVCGAGWGGRHYVAVAPAVRVALEDTLMHGAPGVATMAAPAVDVAAGGGVVPTAAGVGAVVGPGDSRLAVPASTFPEMQAHRPGAMPQEGPTPRLRCSGIQKEGLQRTSDPPVAIEDAALGQPDPVPVGEGLGIQGDPLPPRAPAQVNGEVGVDEDVPPQVQHAADPLSAT